MIHAKPTDAQMDDFSRRVLANLPDSLLAQKSDLSVLVKILPRNSAGRLTALEMLGALMLAEQAQKEFCFSTGGKQ
jgi:hypothetical protein